MTGVNRNCCPVLYNQNLSGELHFIFVAPLLYLLDCFVWIVDFYILH